MKIVPRNIRIPVLAAALAVAVPFATAASAASVDYFLKIDGIQGESVDDQHKGEIDVMSYSLGASHDATAKKKGACLSDIVITKRLDKASPILFANAVSGMVVPSATLTARKAGEGQKDFLVITLKEVIITSVQNGGGGDVPTESVSFSYGSLNLQYKP